MMRCSLISLILLLMGCTQIPEIAKSVESIATDNAIIVKVDRDAMQKTHDVHVSVDVVASKQ